MNRLRVFALAFAFVAALLTGAAAQEIPAPKGLVTDDAGVMGEADRLGLEQRLAEFQARTAVQIAVVVVKSLEGLTVDDYVTRLWSAWRVGREGAGVVVLVAPRDGQTRIEFSPNLVGRLTDEDCATIAREQMVPEFNAGRISAGVVRGADAVMRRITENAARYAPTPPPRDPEAAEDTGSLSGILCVGLVLIGLVILFMTTRGGRQKQGRR